MSNICNKLKQWQQRVKKTFSKTQIPTISYTSFTYIPANQVSENRLSKSALKQVKTDYHSAFSV